MNHLERKDSESGSTSMVLLLMPKREDSGLGNLRNLGSQARIRALSAHSAAEFNSSPGRWQHVWLVAIVPPERWGEMDRNDCHTAWGDFKTLISFLHHSKNYACSFSLIDFLFYFNVVFLSFRLSIAIYRLQVATFSPLA
jgi:hypothetical protein